MLIRVIRRRGYKDNFLMILKCIKNFDNISVLPRQSLLLALLYTWQARGLAAEATICY
jgi:hypothetical protein